jgi:hypothetical protein
MLFLISKMENEMNVFVKFVYALKATYESLLLIARLIELWSFVICRNNREIEDVLVHQQVQYSTLAIKLLSRC